MDARVAAARRKKMVVVVRRWKIIVLWFLNAGVCDGGRRRENYTTILVWDGLYTLGYPGFLSKPPFSSRGSYKGVGRTEAMDN